MNKIDLYDIKRSNYILNINELMLRKVILDSKPLSMHILPTNKCNLACPICNFKDYHDGSFIQYDKIKKILNGNPQLLTVEWSGGGEPLMYPHIGECFDIANDLCIKQIIITNGLLLTEKIIEKICKYDINLILSADGLSKIIYEQMRVNGNFDKLVNNIKILNKYRKKYNHKGFVKIYFIITKQNYKYLLETFDFCKTYNINEIFLKSEATQSIYDIVSHGTIEEKQELQNILKNILIKTKDSSVEYMFDGGINQILNLGRNIYDNKYLKQDYKCLLPWQQVRILPKGEIFFTYFCKEQVGNINVNSLNDIWNSNVAIEYRTKILENNSKTICNNYCLNKDGISKTHSGMERFLTTLINRSKYE